MASVWLLPLIFILASVWLYLCTVWSPNISGESHSGELKFPSTFDDLQKIAPLLQQYYRTNSTFVVLLFCSAYLYKQTFAIPGSVFLNCLAGALFGIWFGFPMTCFLTAVGASCCYLLFKYCGKELVYQFFPDKVKFLQNKVEENKERLPYFLLFLRLFPMTPNWFLNMASPIVNIPLHLFFLSVFFGLMPYNYICVQTGALLSQIQSLDDVYSTATILKLACIAAVVLMPGLLVRKSKSTKTL
ncbi:transmembrane protein 41A-A-like [Tachypleus tridentatus]|uniref:transmembrane protein 41A-A-like n=1 Tax=Tachypleus tridentatus TaxID=6853 RepID=UPI003FD0F208